MEFINTYKTRKIYFTNDFNVDNCVKLFSAGSFPSVNVLYLPSPYMVTNENRNDFIKLFPNVNHIYIRASSMYYIHNSIERENQKKYNLQISELIIYFVSCNILKFGIDNCSEYNSYDNLNFERLTVIMDKLKYMELYNNLIKYTQFIELEDHSYDKYINPSYVGNHLKNLTNFR